MAEHLTHFPVSPTKFGTTGGTFGPMDVVAVGRASSIRDVVRSAQTLTIWRREGERRSPKTPTSGLLTRPARIYSLTRQDDGRRATKTTIAGAARGAVIQLPYKKNIPREPRTRAIADNATRDKRTKFMLEMIRGMPSLCTNSHNWPPSHSASPMLVLVSRGADTCDHVFNSSAVDAPWLIEKKTGPLAHQ